jgi:hypothetical protein
MNLRRLLGRERQPEVIEHAGWGEPTGRPRVLVESPDQADLWAHAEVLRAAGYEVALCTGPKNGVPRRWRWPLYFEDSSQSEPAAKPVLCPLVAEGRCALAEGADVVVSSPCLPQSQDVLAALRRSSRAAVVVEQHPVTKERLLSSVQLAAHREDG